MLPCMHSSTAAAIVQMKTMWWFVGLLLVFLGFLKPDLKGKNLQSPQNRAQSPGVPATPPCPS